MPGTSRTNSAILTRKRARESEKFCRFSFWVREGSRGLYASKVTALGVSRCRGNSDDAALTLLARALVSLRVGSHRGGPSNRGTKHERAYLGAVAGRPRCRGSGGAWRCCRSLGLRPHRRQAPRRALARRQGV